MKRSIAPLAVAVALAVGIATGTPVIAQSDPAASQTVDIPGVRSLEISGPANVTITVGAPEQVVITADQADLDRMRIDLDDDEVDISFDRGLLRDKEPFWPDFDRHRGRDTRRTRSGWRGRRNRHWRYRHALGHRRRRRLVVSMIGVTASSLELDASGASQVEISGSVDTQDVEVSKASSYELSELTSRFTSVEASDASRATVRTEGSLQVEAAMPRSSPTSLHPAPLSRSSNAAHRP